MDDVENAIVAVRDVVSVERAEPWFDAVCRAYDEAGQDWARFAESLPSHAADSGTDSAAVELFMEALSAGGDPLTTVGELAAHRDELPARYATLLETAEPAAATGATALGRVTDEQRARLAAGVGDGWPEVLRAKLDEVWPDWLYAEPDTLASFVDDWMDAIIAEGAEEASAEAAGVTALGWVTDEQRTRLAAGVGDGWPEVLRAKLNEVWPDWPYAEPDTLASFVDDWADAIIAESSAGSGAAEGAAATEIEKRVAAELAGRTELAAAFSAEEFEVLVGEVMREQVAGSSV
jgi:hypothetical protein